METMTLANDTMTSPATTSPTIMNNHERLTWDEICRRYPDEWVVVVEIQPVNEIDEDASDDDEMKDVRCGPIEECTSIVVAHHKTRKEASPSVREAMARYDEVGAFFTGRLVPWQYDGVVP